MSQEIEIRSRPAMLEVRTAEDGTKTIRGYAVLFNTESEDMGGFREIILPGALTRTLQENPDVKAFWNHNSDLILGRTTAGTLKLEQDDKGLSFEIVPPASPAGENARVAVARGDVSQMSFGFRVRKDELHTRDDGTLIREVQDLDLFEVSPVVFPAYAETTSEVRSKIEAHTRTKKPLAINRERIKLELLYRE